MTRTVPKERQAMHELHDPYRTTDLLDRLVLDICELEGLTKSLAESIAPADLLAIPRGRTAVQLMDALLRIREASGELHRLSGHQIKRVASALSSDLSSDGEPIGVDHDRIAVDVLED